MLTLARAGLHVGGRWLVRGADLAVAPGEKVGLRGPSGTGKSLLLRALAGLDRLAEGEITFMDRPLSRWHLPAYRTRVAYVAQHPAALAETVEADLRVPFTLAAHAARRFDADRARALLARLGRPDDFATQRTSALSGGERQVTAFVRTLLTGPDLLLLDEPTASLDATTSAALEAIVDDWLGASEARALVWVSHDPAQIERVASRAVTIEPGAGLA